MMRCLGGEVTRYPDNCKMHDLSVRVRGVNFLRSLPLIAMMSRNTKITSFANLHNFILFNHGISKEDWIKNHIGASQVKQPLKQKRY